MTPRNRSAIRLRNRRPRASGLAPYHLGGQVRGQGSRAPAGDLNLLSYGQAKYREAELPVVFGTLRITIIIDLIYAVFLIFCDRNSIGKKKEQFCCRDALLISDEEKQGSQLTEGARFFSSFIPRRHG